MIVEIIATSVEDAKTIEAAGGDRIELCAALSEDGLTPSIGLIEAVVQAVQIPVHVMVRPHNRGFHYSQDDLRVMKADIHAIKKLGAAGIVLGPLTEDLTVDEEAMTFLLADLGSLDVTFHRAFDLVHDRVKALEVISNFHQVRRILTSGGQATAIEGCSEIKQLMPLSKRVQVDLLAGSGLTVENCAAFVIETNVSQVHFGSAVRQDKSFMNPIIPEKITAIKQLFNGV